MKWFAACAALLAGLVLAGLTVGGPYLPGFTSGWKLPDRWNPFAALRVDEVPGLLTRFKLGRLSDDPQRCLDVLATSAMRFKTVPDRSVAPGCGFDNAVRIERSSVALSAPITLSCPSAVALALWEQHGMQVAAQRHFQEPVVRIEHLGSYVCRNIDGLAVGTRSQHATANALDVAGFVLRSGRRVRVLDDWESAQGTGNGTGNAKGKGKGNSDRTDEDDRNAERFLHEARDHACEFFNGVLSPDYNAAHADHFHFDRSPYRLCR